jgi:hypothetical protein
VSDYKHHGVPESGTWGAMTAPVGARTDMAVQRAREAIAAVLSAVTWAEWEAPAPARMVARARARG